MNAGAVAARASKQPATNMWTGMHTAMEMRATMRKSKGRDSLPSVLGNAVHSYSPSPSGKSGSTGRVANCSRRSAQSPGGWNK